MKQFLIYTLGGLYIQTVSITFSARYARAELTDGRILECFPMETEEANYYGSPYEAIWTHN